jgi:hypothetical protein
MRRISALWMWPHTTPSHVAEMREPLGVVHHGVEEIPTDDEQPHAPRRAMDRFLADRDAAEGGVTA